MNTFISYSRANSDFAVRLASDLKAAGFDVWLDQLDIPTGARWDDEIERALEKSRIFLIVLSPESTESQNVKDEVGYAIDSGKYILPVLTRACRIPLRLRRFQFVDFTDKPYEDSLTQIKHLLSNSKKLAATDTARKAAGNLEIPAADLEPMPPVKNISRPKQASAKRLEAPKTQRTWYLALLFLGICAVAVIGLGAIIFSSPGLLPFVRPPASPPILVTTAAATRPIQPIAIITTIAPSETSAPSETPTPTVQPDLCAQVAGQSFNLDIVGGFQGIIGPSGIVLISKGSASYEFTTVAAFPNEQLDTVTGTCEANLIKFTRTRPQAFVQDYEAAISKNSDGILSLEGSLTDRASGKRVRLSGQVTAAITPMGLCDQLAGKSLNIKHASGFQGVIAPGGIKLIAKGDGTYSFSTVAVYLNEQADPTSGNCQGNTLTFTRTRANAFIQDFQATISQNAGVLSFIGSFTDRQSGAKDSWTGQVTDPQP